MRTRKRAIRTSTLIGALILGLLTPLLPLGISDRDRSASAQMQSEHPFEGHSIIYVQQGDRWREAMIVQYMAFIENAQVLWSYGVRYLDNDAGEIETGVRVNRIRTIEGAQIENLTDHEYFLESPAGVEQMLAAHNIERQAVGVPDLRWSADLAASAQAWADELMRRDRFEHSPASRRNGGRIGENLAISTSGAPGGAFSHPERAIRGWVQEQNNYNAQTNTCTPGRFCGHYTQIVWRNTTQVGCGVARNPEETKEIWVCHYNPAGNVVGQRPY